MRLSECRPAAALVAFTLVAIVVAWWLASTLTVVPEEVVSSGIVMSGSGDAQPAQSGASQSGVPITQYPSGGGEQPPSPPADGNVAPAEAPAPPPPPMTSTPAPTPIVPAPPIDLDDDDYDNDIDDVDDSRDDD